MRLQGGELGSKEEGLAGAKGRGYPTKPPQWLGSFGLPLFWGAF